MTEDFMTLLLPVHVEFLLQIGIEVPMSPSKAFSDHDLTTTLLDIPQEPLVVGVKVVMFFRRGR
jgi:hypothetical protein